MSAPSHLVSLAQNAPFIFVGSVGDGRAAGATTTTGGSGGSPVVIERTIQTPEGFTLAAGQTVNVRLARAVSRGTYVFFAELVAARDVLELLEHGHVDAEAEGTDTDIADAIRQAYAALLAPRLEQATLVALATVGAVKLLGDPPGQDDASVGWASAPLEIERVLSGKAPTKAPTLVGPRKPSRLFLRAPAVRAGREAVFLFQTPPEQALDALPARARAGAVFVADTADIQPPESADEIAALVASPKRGGDR